VRRMPATPGAPEDEAHDADPTPTEGEEAPGANGHAGQTVEQDAGASGEARVDEATVQQLRTAFEEGRAVVEDALGLAPDEGECAPAPDHASPDDKPPDVLDDDAVGGTVAE
jgi:hypothetical protein